MSRLPRPPLPPHARRRAVGLLALVGLVATGLGLPVTAASADDAPAPVAVDGTRSVGAATAPTDLMDGGSQHTTASVTVSAALRTYLVDGLGVDVGSTPEITGIRTGATVTLDLASVHLPTGLPDSFEGPGFDHAHVVIDPKADRLQLDVTSSARPDARVAPRVADVSTTALAASDLKGTARFHATVFGTDVALTGRLGATDGQPAFDLHGALASDVQRGGVLLARKGTLTLRTADGLRFSGRALLGDASHPLDVLASGTVDGPTTWTLAASPRKGARSWQPVRGLRLPASFSGSIVASGDTARFDVKGHGAAKWKATTHVTIAADDVEFADQLPDSGTSCPTTVIDGRPWLAVRGASTIPAGEAGTYAGTGALCVEPASGDGYLTVDRPDSLLLEPKPVALHLSQSTLHGPVNVTDRRAAQLDGVGLVTAGDDPATAVTTHASVVLTAAGPIVVDFRGDPTVMAMEDSHDQSAMEWASAELHGYRDQTSGDMMDTAAGMSMADGGDAAPPAPTADPAAATPTAVAPAAGSAAPVSLEPGHPVTLLAYHVPAATPAGPTTTTTTAARATSLAGPTTSAPVPATKSAKPKPTAAPAATATTTTVAPAAATTTTTATPPATTAPAVTPAGPTATYKLAGAVVSFLTKNLNVSLGSDTLSGSLSNGVLTLVLPAPSGLPVTLPGDAGTLTFGATSVAIDTAANTATFSAQATTTSGIGANLQVTIAHAASTSLLTGNDLSATLSITGVPVLGTTIDVAGTLSLTNGTFSAALTGTLGADLAVAPGVVLTKGATFTIDKATGLQVAGTLAIGQSDAPLTVAVSGSFQRLSDWSLTIAQQPGAGAWLPVPQLSIAPSVAGHISRAAGKVRFDVTVDQPVAWQPTPGLSFAVNHVEISNDAPPATARCPDGIAEGNVWIDAAGSLAYAAANATVNVETCIDPSGRRFTTTTTATTDHLLSAAAGFDLTGAGLTVTADIGAKTFVVTGHATVAVPTKNGTLTLPVGLSFGSDGSVIGAAAIADLSALDPGLSGSGSLFVSTKDVKGFTAKSVFPDQPTLASLASFDLHRGIDAVFGFALDPTTTRRLQSLHLVASANVQAVAAVTTTGVSLSLDLRFGDGTSGLVLFARNGAGVYLNGASLGLSLGAANKVSLSGTGTLAVPAMVPGGKASQVSVTLSGAFDFTSLNASLGFDLFGTCNAARCPWANAFGIDGMSVDELGGTLGIDFATAVPTPTASIEAKNLVLPATWATAIGMVPGTAISFAANLNAAQPLLSVSLKGNPVALTPLAVASSDPNVRSSFEVNTASLVLAPFGGTTATGDVVTPGVSVLFDGTVLHTTIHVDATVSVSPPRIDANVHFGPLPIGRVQLADTYLRIHAGTDGFSFAFNGGFDDGRGFSFNASISLNATTQLQGAGIVITPTVGVPGYLTLSGSLTGSVSVGGNGALTMSASGYAYMIINGQYYGGVTINWSLDSGMLWQQLGEDAAAVAQAFRNAYGWSAQTVSQALSQLQYSSTQTFTALQSLGDSAKAALDAFVALFHTGQYYIWSKDGQVLDVQYGSQDSEAPVIQWFWNGGANQRWVNVPTDSGWYEIVNVNSGLCLTVSYVDNTPGRSLIQYPCRLLQGQQWYQGSGYSAIWNRQSGQVVDIPGATILAGTQLEQWPSNGGWNQTFSTSPG